MATGRPESENKLRLCSVDAHKQTTQLPFKAIVSVVMATKFIVLATVSLVRAAVFPAMTQRSIHGQIYVS